MSHNKRKEIRGFNRISLVGVLDTLHQIRLKHLEERDIIESNEGVHDSDYEELTFKIACIESAENHIRMAISN